MISLVATVLNEKVNLPEWLEGLLSQSVLPDEVVIVDGGSADGTWEYLKEKSRANTRLKVFKHPGNISVGRNFAVGQAQGDLIVVTDAGCNYHHDWFKKIAEAVNKNPNKFAATAFGPWLKKEDGFLTYLISAATIPAPDEFARDWLPSSRSVAFSKELWQKAGGYPEWLPICEDVMFDLKIKKLGVAPELAREPLVFWRPRTTLGAYFKQLFKYTRSDGQAGLWLYRQLIRYATYISAILLVYLSLTQNLWWTWLILAGLVVYLQKFWNRWLNFTQGRSFVYRLSGQIVLPLIIAWGDLAKMCGWPVGVYDHWSGRIRR